VYISWHYTGYVDKVRGCGGGPGGDTEIWRYGNIEIWRYGDMEIGDMEIWRCGDWEIQRRRQSGGGEGALKILRANPVSFDEL
jgi:hypothetical protein